MTLKNKDELIVLRSLDDIELELRKPQHDRGFNLPVRNGPVCLQKSILFIERYQLEAMLLIESNSPGGICPGSYQDFRSLG